MNSFFDLHYAEQILPALLRASMYTIFITLIGFAIALVLGLVLAVLRRSPVKAVSRTVGFIVEFIRSTPLLIQVYVLFYLLPVYGITMSALTAGTVGIALHYACYTSEVYRAGLNGVARGQWEAACALSLSPWRTYSGVILPKAIRP
ncbi:MAG: ABC transporter permease subunit, partial [Burkholderia sp.]|nr:ABC transporter permease subunit [Burkholderia sp.]